MEGFRIMKKLDLVGLGSAIIDFAPVNLGVPLSKVKGFVPSAGGAVSNILVAASRLGLRTGFIGCVGDDEFGTFILNDFKKEGVDTSAIKRVKGKATGLAFYSIDEHGERNYVFYRFPGYADPESSLRPEDIKPDYIRQAKVFHFSESLLRKGETRGAVLHALEIAKKNSVLVSYDPNIRTALWESRRELISVQKKVIQSVDIFVATFTEASLITGKKGADESVKRILDLGPRIVLIRTKNHYVAGSVEGILKIPMFTVKAVDTSGAGDAFDAGFLTGLIKNWPLEKAVLLGSAVAAIKVTKIGTRTGLPSFEEAVNFMTSYGKDRLTK